MAITLYSGTPGSGKSLNANRRIVRALKNGINVIANYPVDIYKIQKKYPRKKLGKFIYWEDGEITVDKIVYFAKENHNKKEEGQTLIVLDEAINLFNPRDFRSSNRKDFIKFFTQHRKLGFEILLITQNDRFLDKQIRALIEYEVRHRKVNNFGNVGALIPFKLFIAIELWYPIKQKTYSKFFRYKKFYGELYDTYAIF